MRSLSQSAIFRKHVECLPVAGVLVHVEQARRDLVERVVRSPDGSHLSARSKNDWRIGGEKTSAVAFGGAARPGLRQLGDDVIGLCLQLFVAGAGVHQCQAENNGR